MTSHKDRIQLAKESLKGLSVGDALGEALSYRFYEVRDHLDFSVFRDHSVRYTDDTAMAKGIVEILELLHSIDQDALAWKFSSNFINDPDRGYGKMARKILRDIASGSDWLTTSSTAFGHGSFGNGAAMRVAPLGVYYSDEIDLISNAATLSAQVTHYHPEAVAGAIAVAVAAGTAAAQRGKPAETARDAIWRMVEQHTPTSEVKARIQFARESNITEPKDIANEVGNGTEISAQDTVPFCIWSACKYLANYQEALLNTIEVGGDCDTNAAIVGGIVSAYTGLAAIPEEWLRVTELVEFSD